MAAPRTSRDEVIAAAVSGSDTQTITLSGSLEDLPEKGDIEKGDVETPCPGLERTDTRVSFGQQIGVTKIESLYMVFPKGWKLIALWTSIGLIAYVWSLAAITTAMYSPFATSSFGKHTVVGTMGVINNIMAAVALPFLSKICDAVSRPAALSVASVLFGVGYICAAAAPNVYSVVVGEAILNAGRTGMYQIMHILISDMTQLQWRGLAIAAYSLPWILNGFVSAEIATSLGVFTGKPDAWRWGYGMFALIVPVAISPSILVMFWGHHRAKKLGALSLASSTYARRRVLEGLGEKPKKTWYQLIMDGWSAVDGFGLLLFAFGLVLLLAPSTLEVHAKGGYKNPSLIAMYCCGGVIFIGFVVWDVLFAKNPIWPGRLMNRTFLLCVAVDAIHFFSLGLTDAYYNSWVFIMKPDWTDREYSYFSNIHNVGLCFFAVCTGVVMYFTKKYRHVQIIGLSIRAIGEGINYYAASNRKDVTFIMAKILISCGAGMIVTTTAVAAPASAPHRDMAGAMCILHMVAQVTGSIANSISASVWNSRVPKALAKYLPDVSEAERELIFGNIRRARRTLPHAAVYDAYTEGIRPLLAAAIGTTILALALACFIPEMKLDRRHNNIENHKIVRMHSKHEVTDEAIKEQVAKAEERARNEVVKELK